MKKKRMLLICIVFLVALLPTTLSTEWYGWLYGEELSGVHGNPVNNWYDISQWEVDVCFNWGGVEDPNQISQNNVGQDIYNNLIVTLQAEVSDPLGEESISNGMNVYEVAWFIQPTDTDEDINFEVHIIDDNYEIEIIESGNANYVNGYKGYYVVESDKVYTNATIKYSNEGRDEELKVPFVG